MENKKYMTVDGVTVEINGEKNLLEIIRKVGIEMPTFCYYSELSIYGACRMCMVENEWGGFEASCSTPPKEGMNIKTNTERLRKYRKTILELLLANHCRDCTTCEKSTSCKLQDFARKFKLDDIRFPNSKEKMERDSSSPCIVKDKSKCILCGDCVRVCNEVQKVGAIDFAHRGSKMTISTAFNKPLADSPCVGCGQCVAVCPTGALVLNSEMDKIWSALSDSSHKTSIQIAPAVRVAIGKELGIKEGENVMGKIVSALRLIGFNEVYDTTLSADLTVLEETNEFLSRLQNGGKLPLMTSCCPAWIQFVEKKHPELIENISTCRSPMQMLASIVKAQANKKCEKHFHVAVMPCTAKKFEASREEFTMNGERNVDAVLTTKGLIRMIQESGINFATIKPSAVDMPFNSITGAGVIFGVTGGVTEAVLRRVSSNKDEAELSIIANSGQRGDAGIKEFELPFGRRMLKIAVCSGLGNAEKLIKRIEKGEKFDFVEVMACPGGCVNGGGQPFSAREVKAKKARGLYQVDESLEIRSSEQNPVLEELYNTVLKDRVHELLHVHYGKKN
jgi:NADH-quinone oxidoreductase subunit G